MDQYFDLDYPASFSGASTFYKSLNDNKIKLNDVKDFLKSSRGYTLHKTRKLRWPRNKTNALFPGEILQADLCDMQSLAPNNNGVKYILTAIDVYSQYAYAVPLKDKKAKYGIANACVGGGQGIATLIENLDA